MQEVEPNAPALVGTKRMPAFSSRARPWRRCGTGVLLSWPRVLPVHSDWLSQQSALEVEAAEQPAGESGDYV